MATTDPVSIKSKIKSSINKLPRRGTILLIAVAIVIILLLAAFAIYKLATRHHGPKPLESVAYMEKNCPIVVPVNVFVARGYTNEKFGVSVQGKLTPITAKKPSVKYTWQIPSSDDFCGIVGEWAGPKGPRDVSLRPTTQTAHGGEYTDTSLNSKNGLHLNEFFVYARPKAK
jgi:hypothetical protein